MKTFIFLTRWALAIMFGALLIAHPEVFAITGGVAYAANFITTSITWGGKENLDYFLRPMFIGKSPLETKGVRVIPNVTSGQKLNYFGTAAKILKAYAKGFNGAAGTTYTQRTITTTRMKAEAADDALEFYNNVFEAGLRKDDWNNLDDTFLKEIIIGIYKNAVASDVYRQFWLNDTNKETISGGKYTGTADADYNAFQGMWSLLMANSATTPSDTQIKRVAFSNGAAAQVATVTLNGGGTTTSTLILTINGVNYSRVYITSYTQTATNWVATNAAALLLRGIVATSSGADIILTSAIAGQPFTAPAFATASTVTGLVAATTPNTVPAALAAGESEDTFLLLHDGADAVLRNIKKTEKVFLVSSSVYQNYQTFLESQTTEGARSATIDGIDYLTYRGIPVIDMGWDEHLNADFPTAYPHRIIYTEQNNLVLGIDSMNQFNETKMWYNPDAEENRFRTKLVMGCQYVHNKMTAIAY